MKIVLVISVILLISLGVIYNCNALNTQRIQELENEYLRENRMRERAEIRCHQIVGAIQELRLQDAKEMEKKFLGEKTELDKPIEE